MVVVINERSVQTLMETIPNLLLRYNLLDKTKKKLEKNITRFYNSNLKTANIYFEKHVGK